MCLARCLCLSNTVMCDHVSVTAQEARITRSVCGCRFVCVFFSEIKFFTTMMHLRSPASGHSFKAAGLIPKFFVAVNVCPCVDLCKRRLWRVARVASWHAILFDLPIITIGFAISDFVAKPVSAIGFPAESSSSLHITVPPPAAPTPWE